MTSVADKTELDATERYRAAVAQSTDEDRAYAVEVTSQVIEVIKAFGAVKNKLHNQSQADNIEVHVLMKLAKTGPMRASDLAEHLCTDPSTVSRQVAGLVKHGLIERGADPRDGRASILVATSSGLDRVEHMIQMRGRLFAPLMADWSEGDREVFLRLLSSFAGSLGENIEPLKDVASENFDAQRSSA